MRLVDGPRPARLAFRGAGRAHYAALVARDDAVVTAPPGRWRVVCNRTTGPREGGGVEVDVVDPDDLWVDATMACELSDACNGIGTLRWAGGDNVVASIRRSVPGIASSDTIQPTGYPEEVEEEWIVDRYRVVRDGRIIGSITIRGSAEALRDGGISPRLVRALGAHSHASSLF